jgi:RNA polymerase sigma-70 factor (ECF subfamily)
MLTQKPSESANFRRIYDEHHAEVLSYCLRRASLEDAKDAAAEVFLVAWRRLNDVPHGDGSLPWLYATARKVLANQRRSRTRRFRLVTRLRTNPPAAPEGPETVVVRRERDHEVLEALSRLRPSDREVIQLALWEEMPQAAIGEVLGCSDRAITMRLHRALKRLDRAYRSRHQPAIAPAFAPDTEATSD